MKSPIYLSLLLGACSFAPEYHAPDMGSIPAEYKENKDWAPAKPADNIPRGKWWEVFNNLELNQLEEQVTSANQDLKAAAARFDQARAQAGEARADLFPTVNGVAGFTRQHNSQGTANVSPNNQYNTYQLGADLSYEIDIWGRVRNAVSAAESRAKASEADMAVVDLSLHAELAMDYFSLRGADASQAVLDDAVDAYQKALDLTKRRHVGGVVSEVDVDQADTQLQNAKTAAADMKLKRAQLENAIAVLVGKIPSEFAIAIKSLDAKPPVLEAGLPATLLERRPDIAEAERLASAANDEIGVARAVWFPTISLTGLLGFESDKASSLIKAPSRFWSLGPSAVMTIFDAGRIDSLNDEARAAYNETVANYRQTSLKAYQEVEDNLAAIHQLDEESKTQLAATQSADRALAQAKYRYVGGLTTYVDVVVAENQELQSKLSAIDINVKQMTASVELVKAMGGGWQQQDAAKPESEAKP